MLTWEELLPDGSFRDGRLRVRAVAILTGLLRVPGASFAAVFGKGSAPAKRAYDFCENTAIDVIELLIPCFLSLGRALREMGGETILCVQDSSELDLSHLRKSTGFGEIGNPKNRGLLFHCGLAVSTQGLVLGLLSALTWTRDPSDHGKAIDRKNKVFDAKESSKWWRTIVAAERAVACPQLLLHVGDREADILDVFARAALEGYRLLVRAAQDRIVVDSEHQRLWSTAENWRVMGKRELHLPYRPPSNGKPARPARTALVTLRFGQVSLGKNNVATQVPLSAVLVREENAPDHDEIEWLLLTNDVLADANAAWKRVDWYRLRWLIEEFHNCLKTTCAVESRQFEERAHFETFFALNLQVASRLLYLRGLARVEPDMPAAAVLDDDELDVLRARHTEGAKDSLPPAQALTLRHAIRLIAILGGFMARQGDGEPGFMTLARGYTVLRHMADGYRLALGLPPIDSLNRHQPSVIRLAYACGARSST